jgi:serine protein kinase
MLEFVQIVPVPLTESLGTVTGKYPAKDKITSSAVDLLGEESIQRLLHITDTNNPYRFDLRRGALARVAGGGIHFSDEIYKTKGLGSNRATIKLTPKDEFQEKLDIG